MNHPRYFPVLEHELQRMRGILAHGLPNGYVDFDEFLADYFADFSWSPEAARIQYAELLDSAEWMALAAQIKESRFLDFVAQVTFARDLEID